MNETPKAAPTVMREAHFPGRAPVDSYGAGGFRFADMSHRGSILCLPSGIYEWSVADATELDVAAMRRVLDEADTVEVLLVGTGTDLVPLPDDVKTALRDRKIGADPMSTGAAVRTFNVLLSEGRPVAAALIAV